MHYFVTGTDTDSGKTLISSALLYLASQQANTRTLGLKPIASGCQQTQLGLRNGDALALMAQSNVKLDYNKVNPICFEPAIAPHIAAAQTYTDISPKAVLDKINYPHLPFADFLLIEGAGGWRLPLGNNQYLSQVVQDLSLPVILVVGMKLGCLNHALLTQEAILADGLSIAGWVANCVDPKMRYFDENLASLTDMMQSQYLGVVPYLAEPTAQHAAKTLSLPECGLS